MSNKPAARLWVEERRIRSMVPAGMRGGNSTSSAAVDVTIELLCGFELFNTRPYHNYEAWSQGWRVRGQGLRVEREDLDDAIRAWCELVGKVRAGHEPRPNEIDRPGNLEAAVQRLLVACDADDQDEVQRSVATLRTIMAEPEGTDG